MEKHDFYGWETADIKDCRGLTPRDCYGILSEVWSADTCAPRMRADWSPENKTLGQCSVTAFLMQDIFGGEVRGVPLGDGGFHCFNAVGECVFDLTSAQFGEALDYSDRPVQLREVHFQKEEKRLRYELLKARFFARLPADGYCFVTLREMPDLKETAAKWFHSKWSAPEEAYLECMEQYLTRATEYGWYLCLYSGRVVGGLGVIENDFHDRKDLSPNVCAVYTEPEHRGKGVAGRLLNMAVEDMRSKGISPLYLLTDHTGFYERYGWEFFCMAQGDGEPYKSRMYIHR